MRKLIILVLCFLAVASLIVSCKEEKKAKKIEEAEIYVARVEVPKYYRWFELIGSGRSNALIWNNYFYTIEADEAEENFYVKRYK